MRHTFWALPAFERFVATQHICHWSKDVMNESRKICGRKNVRRFTRTIAYVQFVSALPKTTTGLTQLNRRRGGEDNFPVLRMTYFIIYFIFFVFPQLGLEFSARSNDHSQLLRQLERARRRNSKSAQEIPIR
jgi:hypothetical protein